MATLASWYEDEMEAGAAESNAGSGDARGANDPYRVRAFPNEDVCLWVKPIDNSRVVREADPRLLEACWRFISVASMAAILLVGLLLPNAYGMLAGYKLHKLQQERELLVREQAALELEESRLLSPQRLEELAGMQEFVDPPPQQVVHLGPNKDRSLAMNQPAKPVATATEEGPQ